MKKTIMALAIATVSSSAFACGGAPSCDLLSGSAAASSSSAVVGPNGGSVNVGSAASASNTTSSRVVDDVNVVRSSGETSSTSWGTQTGDAFGVAGSFAVQGGVAAGGNAAVDADATVNGGLFSGRTSGGIAGGAAGGIAGQASGAATGVVNNGNAHYWTAAGAENASYVGVDVDSYSCASCVTTEMTLSGFTSGYSYVNGGGSSSGTAAGAAGGIAGQAGEYGAEGASNAGEYRLTWRGLKTNTTLEGDAAIGGSVGSFAAAGGASAGEGEVRFYQGSSVGSEAEAYSKIRNCGNGGCGEQSVAETFTNSSAAEYFEEGNAATSYGHAIVGGTTAGSADADAYSVNH